MSFEPSKGPRGRTLSGFLSSIASMPAKHRASFNTISNESLARICSPTAVHLWETDSDIPSLLQLTQVIMKVKDMSTYVPLPHSSSRTVPQGMIILVAYSPERNDFERVCELVKWLTDQHGKLHLDGGVMSFPGIKVVQGVDNSRSPDRKGRYHSSTESEAREAVERVNKCIEHTLGDGAGAAQNLVWHHGPVFHFLNFWINNTTHAYRSALSAISINSSLNFGAQIQPSPKGFASRPSDYERLEEYCNRLGIFAMFTDYEAQGISSPNLATYIYFYAYYIHAFLPSSILEPHLHEARDQLVLFAFRLYATARQISGTRVVQLVKSQLPHSLAHSWARKCIDPASYTPSLCRSAAHPTHVAQALSLADAPFARFTTSTYMDQETEAPPPALDAFTRLAVGPAAALLADHYICAPIALRMPTTQRPHLELCAKHPSPFRLLIPKPRPQDESMDADPAQMTARVQGVMMGVLELVYRVKGAGGAEQAIGREEGEVWEAVVRASEWALGNCKGEMGELGKRVLEGTERWDLGLVFEEGEGEGGGMVRVFSIVFGYSGVMGSFLAPGAWHWYVTRRWWSRSG